MRIKICNITLIYDRIAHTLMRIQDAPSIDIQSEQKVCYGQIPCIRSTERISTFIYTLWVKKQATNIVHN